jgi:Subtilisin inhibitor-like
VRATTGRITAAIALLGILAAGCDSGGASTGGATSAAPSRHPKATPATRLQVTYFPGGPAAAARDRWTLTCSPTGGDHPRRALACAELAAHPRALAPARRACRFLGVRGAPQALVSGTQRGAAVRRLFRPACDPEWTSLHALLRAR